METNRIEKGRSPPSIAERLEKIEQTFANVNQEFFENLRLFVERVMLFRVTRAEKKNAELDFFIAVLKEAIDLKPQNGEDSVVRSELMRQLAEYRETPNLQLSALFSAMIEATEHLAAGELLYLLERLRTAPILRGYKSNAKAS